MVLSLVLGISCRQGRVVLRFFLAILLIVSVLKKGSLIAN